MIQPSKKDSSKNYQLNNLTLIQKLILTLLDHKLILVE